MGRQRPRAARFPAGRPGAGHGSTSSRRRSNSRSNCRTTGLGALGAAIVAAVGVGPHHPDLDAAVSAMTRVMKEIDRTESYPASSSRDAKPFKRYAIG